MLVARAILFVAVGSFVLSVVPAAIAKEHKSSKRGQAAYAQEPSGPLTSHDQSDPARLKAIEDCSTKSAKISYRDFQTFNLTAYRSCMFDHGQWLE
jgi:hypothetical protein